MEFINKISISDQYFFELLFGLAFISFLYDIQTNTCFQEGQTKNLGLYLFLYFHHVLALFLYIGWLSNSVNVLLFYCFFLVLIVLHWITNDQKCVLTQIVNYYCGFPDEEGFHDIFYFVGMKQKTWFNTFIYSYLFFVFVLSIYKIKELL